ncbi:hypothetical protein DVH24_002302 [Malus domestica]|uniref:Uncharacterized protein n=1 Tax=Malus domestica TaxID=3750 RepID=A0A498I9B4_MALDO|nr:hypothetical protein DVH24_002302 [Malus domestica]
MDAHISAAIASFEASIRADLRAVMDSTLVDSCKAVDSKLAEICQELAMLCHDLAFATKGDATLINPDYKKIPRVGQPNRDHSAPCISSATPIDIVPPLLSSSPFQLGSSNKYAGFGSPTPISAINVTGDLQFGRE